MINAADADSLYEIPLVIHEEGLDQFLCSILQLPPIEPDLKEWEVPVEKVQAARSVRVLIEYVTLVDAYLSVRIP